MYVSDVVPRWLACLEASERMTADLAGASKCSIEKKAPHFNRDGSATSRDSSGKRLVLRGASNRQRGALSPGSALLSAPSIGSQARGKSRPNRAAIGQEQALAWLAAAIPDHQQSDLPAAAARPDAIGGNVLG
jgi:hypothetical protein